MSAYKGGGRPRTAVNRDVAPAFVAAEGPGWTVYLWCRSLWRVYCQGRSYQSAALDVGVDPRTAQQWALGERAPLASTVERMARTGIAIMRIEVKP